MYQIGDRDHVIELKKIPSHSAGAPMPVVFADDNRLILGYETAPSGEEYAIIKFLRPTAHYFGLPNDEILSRYPLINRGLECYGIFEVQHSSWIRSIEKMNKVHPRYSAHNYQKKRHFIFTFHDSIFECVAKDMEVAAHFANEADLLKQHMTKLWWG